jgi:WD40 repeat protein
VAKLNAEGASMLAGAVPGGDVRALQELLAANTIEANAVPILNAQIARFTTQKIVDAGSFVRQLAYSPDGSRIATAEDDGTVRQWESATGKPVGSPIKGHSDAVTAVAFTPDGQTIASTSFDGTMRLFNADTGKALNPNPVSVGSSLTSVAVSPNGGTVITGGGDDTLRSWDPRTGQLTGTKHVFTNRQVAISDVTFDRGGALLAVSSVDGSIEIIDTTTANPHAPCMSVQGDGPTPVYRIAFSPDGHTIASGSNDLELWNADTSNNTRTIQVGARKINSVGAVAFSPDGRRIATGRNDGAVQLWDADTGTQLGETLTGHTSGVFGAAFSPDGRQLATASMDGTLRLWKATVGQPMRGPDPAVTQVAFSLDGHRVATAGDTSVQQWDVASGLPRPPLTVSGAGRKSFGFVDGNRMVTVASDGTVQVWDANTGQPVRQPVHINIQGRYIEFAFSSDGRMVASGDQQDGTLQLWDVATGRARGQPITVDTPNAILYRLAFSPDGHHLVAGYNDGLRLWNTDTTQPEGTVMTTTHGSIMPVMAVAFSRDGSIVASGREDGAVELWDAATRKPLPNSPLSGHSSGVVAVAFGLGNHLASGGIDGTLRLWDTSTGKPTAAPLTESDTVTDVAVSPDGRLVASSSIDGNVLLSPAIADPSQLCDKLTSNMSDKQWRDWVDPGIGYKTVCS